MSDVVQYYEFKAVVLTTAAVQVTLENSAGTVAKLNDLWATHQSEREADLSSAISGREKAKKALLGSGTGGIDWTSNDWMTRTQCPDGTAIPAQPASSCDAVTGVGCTDYSVPANCQTMRFLQIRELAFGGAQGMTTFLNQKAQAAGCPANSVTDNMPAMMWAHTADGSHYDYGVMRDVFMDAFTRGGIKEADRHSFTYMTLQMAQPSAVHKRHRRIRAAVQIYLCDNGEVHGTVVTPPKVAYDCDAKQWVPEKWCGGEFEFTEYDTMFREAISFARFKLSEARVGIDTAAQGYKLQSQMDASLRTTEMITLENPLGLCLIKQKQIQTPLTAGNCSTDDAIIQREKALMDGGVQYYRLKDTYGNCMDYSDDIHRMLLYKACDNSDRQLFSLPPPATGWVNIKSKLNLGHDGAQLCANIHGGLSGAQVQRCLSSAGCDYDSLSGPGPVRYNFYDNTHFSNHGKCPRNNDDVKFKSSVAVPKCLKELSHTDNVCTTKWNGAECINCLVSPLAACRTINILHAEKVSGAHINRNWWHSSGDGLKMKFNFDRCMVGGDLDGQCTITVCGPDVRIDLDGIWKFKFSGGVVTNGIEEKSGQAQWDWAPVTLSND
jgi:hypothetical protein